MGRSLPLALGVALFVRPARPAAGACVLVLSGALVLTFSVGAWLGSVLAVATVVALWRLKAVLVLAAGAVAIALASLPLLAMERFSSHFSLSRGTSFIRLQLWESSLRMILDHPLLGVGMDNFLYQYRSSYLLPGAVAEPNLSHPHTLILNFWLQMGILGLAAFLWLATTLARVWLGLWRRAAEPWDLAILAGMAGVAVDFVAHGMVDNSYFLVDMAFHFWLLAGMLAALHSRARME
jgi:O-antigen ligase